MNVTSRLQTSLSVLACVFAFAANAAEPARPNVLFIAIDDLRPELGCYGATHVKTPNIDKFAAQALLFKRAYCQVPVCGASRASLMTGVLPTPTRFTNAKIRADQQAPDAVTLPQVFRSNGYTTLANGKIFHSSADTAERSWSESPRSSGLSHSTALDPATAKAKSAAGRNRMYESPDVPDNAYGDGKVAERTIADLRKLKEAGKPFFLACGFIRPHMPFYAPKKYWDLYEREKIAIAPNRARPENAPAGLKGSGEYKNYHFGDYTDGTDDFHRMMRHGYYASVSYADQLAGQVLAELERLGLAENTIVVIWGDHGWNLGEHNFWGKHNTLDSAVRVPLIIRLPGKTSGQQTTSLVGLYDLFPTLCSLANLPVPESVQGQSFAALFENPQQPFRDAVYTRYVKGDAVVTDQLVYTSYGPDGEMLFDLRKDPAENTNVIAQPAYESHAKRLRAQLAGFQKSAAAAKVKPPLADSVPPPGTED